MKQEVTVFAPPSGINRPEIIERLLTEAETGFGDSTTQMLLDYIDSLEEFMIVSTPSPDAIREAWLECDGFEQDNEEIIKVLSVDYKAWADPEWVFPTVEVDDESS